MKQLFHFFRKLSKNKGVEIEILWLSKKNISHYYYFSHHWCFRGDHAGFVVHFQIFKFEFRLDIYDFRHWNYQENRWFSPGEETES